MWRAAMSLSNPETNYFNGDLARYTGNTKTIHGGLFYEIELLEGHLKGQLKVTQRAPK
ncbi:hypothetical protein D9M73_51900 [compost metagenome]